MGAVDGTASFREFAGILGCKPSYVTQLRKDGRLVLTDNGKRVRVAGSQQRIKDTRDPAKAGVAARHAATRRQAADVAPAATAPPSPPQAPEPEGEDWPLPASDHQRRRAKALADKEEALAAKALRENLVETGKLLPAEDVEHAIYAAGTTLRTTLESLPDTLAPELAAAKDEGRVRVILGEAIEHALEEIARSFATITRSEEGARS